MCFAHFSLAQHFQNEFDPFNLGISEMTEYNFLP